MEPPNTAVNGNEMVTIGKHSKQAFQNYLKRISSTNIKRVMMSERELFSDFRKVV